MLNIPIKITNAALSQVSQMYATKGLSSEYGLRIGVKGGGCSGNSFYLGFDDRKKEDVEFITDSLKIFIEKKHFMYLIGIKLDFIDDNFQRGFTFTTNEK